MLGHLCIVTRQLNAEAAKDQPKNQESSKPFPDSSKSPESSASSSVYTPATEAGQWIPDEERAGPSTEEKIVALRKERSELVANDTEDNYAVRAAFVERKEASTTYFRMESTDKRKAKAKRDWDEASRKYEALILLRDKKNLRLERIELDIAALKRSRPGLW